MTEHVVIVDVNQMRTHPNLINLINCKSCECHVDKKITNWTDHLDLCSRQISQINSDSRHKRPLHEKYPDTSDDKSHIRRFAEILVAEDIPKDSFWDKIIELGKPLVIAFAVYQGIKAMNS